MNYIKRLFAGTFSFCIYIVLLSYAPLCAQDAKADFQKINETYNKTENLSMDVKYELFLDGASAPHETETGKYLKQKNRYFTRQGNNELVITDKFMYVIDKDLKVLAVDKRVDDKKLVAPLSLKLDSLFNLYSKVELINTAIPDTKGYRFYITQGPYAVCDVIYNLKTNFVVEIRNVFREKMEGEDGKMHSAIMKTFFLNVTDKPQNPGIFQDSRYIITNNKKYALSDTYKTFKFINHLN